MSNKIRVAIAGVGNCASSLVQGIEYYRDADPADSVPGLMHVVLGGYHVGDVEFVAAFDVDAAKVGLDLGKAIFAGQNNTIRFASGRRSRRVRAAGPDPRRPGQVLPPDHRGVAARAGRRGRGACARRGADVLVAYLPVGQRGGPEALRPGLPRRQGGLCQRHPRLHRQRSGLGRRSSPTPACRSSATTSRARSAPPSFTASWPVSSRTGAWCSTAPTSSTSAATWTSKTCSSASGWSPRRSPRPRRSPARSTTASRPTTCTSGRRTTWPGWTIASGPTSASKGATSETSRSTSSSSSRSGTRPTRPG